MIWNGTISLFQNVQYLWHSFLLWRGCSLPVALEPRLKDQKRRRVEVVRTEQWSFGASTANMRCLVWPMVKTTSITGQQPNSSKASFDVSICFWLAVHVRFILSQDQGSCPLALLQKGAGIWGIDKNKWAMHSVDFPHAQYRSLAKHITVITVTACTHKPKNCAGATQRYTPFSSCGSCRRLRPNICCKAISPNRVISFCDATVQYCCHIRPLPSAPYSLCESAGFSAGCSGWWGYLATWSEMLTSVALVPSSFLLLLVRHLLLLAWHLLLVGPMLFTPLRLFLFVSFSICLQVVESMDEKISDCRAVLCMPKSSST